MNPQLVDNILKDQFSKDEYKHLEPASNCLDLIEKAVAAAKNNDLDSELKYYQIAQVILTKDLFDFKTKNKIEDSPLHLICQLPYTPKRLELIKLMIAKGADLFEKGRIVTFNKYINKYDDENFITPFDVASEVYLDSHNNAEIVKYLATYANSKNLKDHRGNTPLHKAFIIKDPEYLQLILSTKPAVDIKNPITEKTPLDLFLHNSGNDTQLINILLQNKFFPDDPQILRTAILKGYHHLFESLFTRELNDKHLKIHGQTLMQLACMDGQLLQNSSLPAYDMIIMLHRLSPESISDLDYELSIITLMGSKNKTHTQVAKDLISAYQKNKRKITNTVFEVKYSLLHTLSKMSDFESIKILLNMGANANISVSAYGDSKPPILPIHLNIKDQRILDLLRAHTILDEKARELLIEYGLSNKNEAQIKLAFSQPSSSETAVDINKFQTEIIYRYLNEGKLNEAIKLLELAPFKTGIIDNNSLAVHAIMMDDLTPLHFTFAHKVLQAGGDHIYHCTDPNENDNGFTFFDAAIREDSYPIIKILMERNPNLCLGRSYFYSPESYSIWKNRPTLLQEAMKYSTRAEHLDELLNAGLFLEPKQQISAPMNQASPVRSNQIIPTQMIEPLSVHCQLLNVLMDRKNRDRQPTSILCHLLKVIFGKGELRKVPELHELPGLIGFRRLYEAVNANENKDKLFIFGEIFYSKFKNGPSELCLRKATAILTALNDKDEIALVQALRMKDHQTSIIFRFNEPLAIQSMDNELRAYTNSMGNKSGCCIGFK